MRVMVRNLIIASMALTFFAMFGGLITVTSTLAK